jgi:gamma-glutamylputrescine oxidase
MTTTSNALPASYYEASLLKPRTEYPALNGDIDCDVCIIGGGFAGLHTALNLQEQGLKVVLLEAKRIGIAASGRNGGHVIPEFGGSQSNFEKHLDMASAQRVWNISHTAADRLRQRIEHYQIDCDYQAGHIEAAMTPKHESSLKDWQAHIAQHYGYKNQWISQQEVPQYVGSKRYIAGVIDQNGGHCHPLKLALGLAKALQLGGGAIHEQSAMQNWLTEGNKVRVTTTNGQVTCQHMVLACNVNMETIQNSIAQKLAQRILPVGSWVIATEQLDAQLAHQLIPSKAAVVDMRYILDYFRLSADNRMVFGGGCSYTGQETPANLKQIMREKMITVFPQLKDSKVDFGWGGLIDISMNRMPDFNYTDNSKHVLYMQGFSGSGVVATNAAAKVISDAILGNTKDLALFQAIRHTPFPGGKLLRGPVTAAGMLYHRLLDML